MGIKAWRLLPVFWALAVLWPGCEGSSWSRDITVMVDAGQTDCYFVPKVEREQTLEVSIQVVSVSSATGNLDINLHLISPSKTRIHTSQMISHTKYTHKTEERGDYQVCLDNSYSSFTAKNVFVDFQVIDEIDDYYEDYLDDDELKQMRGMDRDEFHHTLEEFQESLHTIRAYIRDISHLQASLMAAHSQDLHMVIKNGEKITLWSSIHLSFLVVIGLIQVGMVKSLFSDKSFLQNMWRKMQR